MVRISSQMSLSILVSSSSDQLIINLTNITKDSLISLSIYHLWILCSFFSFLKLSLLQCCLSQKQKTVFNCSRVHLGDWAISQQYENLRSNRSSSKEHGNIVQILFWLFAMVLIKWITKLLNWSVQKISLLLTLQCTILN